MDTQWWKKELEAIDSSNFRNETLKEKQMAKKVKSKKKTAKKKVEVKSKGYDEFGRRLGTQGHLIDTKLTKEGKSIEQLAKETKLPVGRIQTHMRAFVSKGFVTKDKKGNYKLKK